MQYRITDAYNDLGAALRKIGKFNETARILESSLRIYLAIRGHGRPHTAIAVLFNRLGRVYEDMGE